MGNNYQPKEDILKAIDLTLSSLLQMANPSEVPEIAQIVCEALIDLNNNLILDKKEKENG